MMKQYIIRLAVALTLAALLTGMLPMALAAGSFQAVVTEKSMKVYAQSGAHELLGALPKGTEVTVLEHSGAAALISWKGKTGIAKVSDMTAMVGGSQEAQTAQEEAVETATASELKSAKAMVTAKAARVYRKPSTSARAMKVPAGVTVNVLATSGGWARVERGGAVGYIKSSALAESGAAEAVETVETAVSEASVTKYDRKAVVTTESCKVYAQPSASSASVSLDKGTELKLLAVKGNVAMVEFGSTIGYMEKGKLGEKTSESAASTAEISTGSSGIFTGTNEQIIFKFLVKEMGYNAAAACGVLSNIKHESGYSPTSNGDSGTSYGIAQWHLQRKTRLIDWCNSNGYDYTTLEGQLYFLKYELKTFYPAVHNKMKSTENSAQGAYDAGYYFCYNFEAPASRESRSVTRGNYARDTLWARYTT